MREIIDACEEFSIYPFLGVTGGARAIVTSEGLHKQYKANAVAGLNKIQDAVENAVWRDDDSRELAIQIVIQIRSYGAVLVSPLMDTTSFGNVHAKMKSLVEDLTVLANYAAVPVVVVQRAGAAPAEVAVEAPPSVGEEVEEATEVEGGSAPEPLPDHVAQAIEHEQTQVSPWWLAHLETLRHKLAIAVAGESGLVPSIANDQQIGDAYRLLGQIDRLIASGDWKSAEVQIDQLNGRMTKWTKAHDAQRALAARRARAYRDAQLAWLDKQPILTWVDGGTVEKAIADARAALLAANLTEADNLTGYQLSPAAQRQRIAAHRFNDAWNAILETCSTSEDPKLMKIALTMQAFPTPWIEDNDGVDTTAEWLYNRFAEHRHEAPWATLHIDDQDFWEHEAAAIRRAFARGGFKRYVSGGPVPEAPTVGEILASEDAPTPD